MTTERSSKTLFVGGLSDAATEQTLHAAFAPFGDIVEINLPRTEGKHRGFGFVVFSTSREVQDAIDNMHLNEVLGRVVTVNVARPLKTSAGGSGAIWQDEEWIKQHALQPDDVVAPPNTTTTTGEQ